MKILIPILGFGQAGGYRVLSKLANELISLGHSVEFLSGDSSKNPYFPTLATIKWIDEKGLITTNKPCLKQNAFSIQKRLTIALCNLPENSYDVILANHSLTTLPIKRAGLAHKTIYYVQAYEPEFYSLSGGLKNRFLAYLSSRSYKMNLFTIVNAEIYLQYKKLTASRILYPGVDLKIFSPKNKELPNAINRDLILGTIGRLEPYKGTRYIILAFKKLKLKYPGIQLHVAFGNPEDFKNEEGIYCCQPHGDEALANFYRSLDYYICAGYTQLGAFHYPVAEAMGCGIPVITTQYYPANETNSWLIKPQNVIDIIQQFELSESNQRLTQLKVAQALIDVKQFEWNAVGKRLDKYIEAFVHQSSIKNSLQ